MLVGVLALQGAFIEQEKMLQKLGADCIELRKKEDLEKGYDALVLPGGESTVQGKLLRELDMFDTLQEQIQSGMPVLATCAGMIFLASELENDTNTYFATIPMCVKRNAYGRQLGSFHTEALLKNIGTVPMTFIRAPYVAYAKDDVDVLATVNNKIVAVQYQNQIALAFHPELDDNLSIHRYFLSLI